MRDENMSINQNTPILKNREDIAVGEIKIAPSILSRAIKNNQEAILMMFKQFIPEDEEVYYIQYLGLQGIWGIGTRSFACLTERRVADITVGRFGEVTYQDGYLEAINSSMIHQPSKLGLYICIGLSIVVSFFTFGLTLLLLPFIVQAYYRLVKCGIVFVIKEGAPVYMFTNRKYLKRANLLCRSITILRENRIIVIKGMPDV
ncbi:MAG: hypothetical protein F6K14_12340 [Symploca sp. SIO2C1]|nr:hypothetical protein [Symploca sp. SIO2C1]